MRYSRKLLTGLGILALALGLSACGAGQNQTNDSNSLTLKTYTVPDGSANDLSGTLDRVLQGSGKHEIGRAWASGSAQVLVLAPQRMQDSIASSLKKMAGKNPASTKTARPVRLDAWIVDAHPGKGPEDPALQGIQPALAAFAKAMGPTHFTEAHYLTAVSDVGSHTTLMPLPGHRFAYGLRSNGNGLVLRFDYRADYHQRPVGLNGQATMQPAQTLVLGLISEQTAEGSAENNGSAVVHRLLVVRITPATQG